jgi:hypothetical protein
LCVREAGRQWELIRSCLWKSPFLIGRPDAKGLRSECVWERTRTPAECTVREVRQAGKDWSCSWWDKTYTWEQLSTISR